MIKCDVDVPFLPLVGNYLDLRERAEAACQSAELVGLPELPPTNQDRDAAAALVTAHAQSVTDKDKRAVAKRAAKATPAALRLTKVILDDFGHAVVDNAVQIRHLVTNKLVQETENPDPRVRIRALELLGKISDVGLFSEKTEVTVTHRSTDDLKEQLRQKLLALREASTSSAARDAFAANATAREAAQSAEAEEIVDAQ